MSANKTVINLYNPGEKRKEELIGEFVIRLREFENIFNDIKSSKMERSEQPYLLVGQRGSGKSTLIQRLRYAIEDDAALNQWLIPITFTEEQYNITELGDLWMRIAEHLEDYHDMPGIVDEMKKQYDSKRPEPNQFDILTRYLHEHKKKIIVFIDNIGDLLQKFKEIEVRRLRSVLQTSADIRLIAASPVMLDEVQDYQKALFQYFKIVRLGGLDKEEMETLLRHLGDKYKSREAIDKIIAEAPERIEIMRRLTGGITRTVVMMYNIFIENAEGSPMNDLYQLLDEATPLYKHKMDDLPPQQQKIVDAVAKKWDAVTTGELAETLRMTSSTISAQLRQLEKDQWIEKIETNTKNHLYQLQERFFNIWYLMRNGRKYEKNRVMWFVKFMEALLEKEEIERRIYALVVRNQDKINDQESLEFWMEVYLECEKISPLTKMILIGLNETLGVYQEANSPFHKKSNEVIDDFFEHPEKLSLEEIKRYIEVIIKVNEGIISTNNAEELLLKFILQFAKIKSQTSKDFWVKVMNEDCENDKSGFIDLILTLLLSPNESSERNMRIQKTFEKGNINAINFLFSNLNFSTPSIAFFRKTFSVINPYYHNFKSYKFLQAFIELLENNIEKSTALIEELLSSNVDKLNYHETYFQFQNYFIVLVAKYQYQLAHQLVMNEKVQLNNRDRPLYYALMHYMRDEHPNEYLRMPPEMKETTEDIIRKIEAFRAQDQQATEVKAEA